MHKNQDKENRALVHVPEAHGVSDSEDDKPLPSEARKKLIVKGLCFSNSPVKRHALAVNQARESTRIPMIRHRIRSSGRHLWITVQRYAWTMHHTKVRCHGTCKCGGMSRPCKPAPSHPGIYETE